MDIREIQNYLPHRYPFLLIDRVLELEVDSHILAYKNVTINEEVFQGHFPIEPIFPGVLIIEALAQASALLGFRTLELENSKQTLCYLTKVDGFRFRSPVTPGDQLYLDVRLKTRRRNIGVFDCKARVGDRECCSGMIQCAYAMPESD